MTSNINPEVIDPKVAGQLIAHKRMGQSAFERLVPVFLEESRMLVSQLRCAIAASDYEGLHLTAHKLKGSASVIGANEVREIAQQIMVQGVERTMPSAEQMHQVEQKLSRFQVEASHMIGMQKRLLAMQSKDITVAILEKLFIGQNVAIRTVTAKQNVIETATGWMPDVILISGIDDENALFALCRAIRTNTFLCEVPLMVMSGTNDRYLTLAILRSGADDCLCSPVDMVELGLKLGNKLKLLRMRRSVAERNMFRTVSEHVEHGILLVDRTRHVMYANQMAHTDCGVCTDSGSTWMEQLAGRFTLCDEQEWVNTVDEGGESHALMMFEGKGGEDAD